MTADADLERRVLAAVERLGRALRAARQDTATRHQVSQLGLGVLETLSDGVARRIGDLAAELDVSQPTLSEAVNALQRRGLIARTRDPLDMRSSRVSLTEDGRSVAAAVAAELEPVLAAKDSSDAEFATTLKVLLREIARLQTAGVITVNRSCLTCHHHQPAAGRAPARCLLLGVPLRDHDLRVDCPEHVERTPVTVAR